MRMCSLADADPSFDWLLRDLGFESRGSAVSCSDGAPLIPYFHRIHTPRYSMQRKMALRGRLVLLALPPLACTLAQPS
eukprot:5803432-Pyramimonas_sp.AAC.1